MSLIEDKLCIANGLGRRVLFLYNNLFRFRHRLLVKANIGKFVDVNAMDENTLRDKREETMKILIGKMLVLPHLLGR